MVKQKQIKKKQNRRRKEKYYICPYCGDLKTFTSILADCEQGGPGMCDCQFTQVYWDQDYQDLNIDTSRIYHEYIQISKKWYEYLKKIHNDVLRLDALRQIPRLERLK